MSDATSPETQDDPPVERFEVVRLVPADAATIFAVLCDPQGHVDIDSTGMLMDATGDPVRAVGDRFVVHMDRESLNDYPLGRYDVTVVIETFEQDRDISWSILGAIEPPIGHTYGYRLEPAAEGGTTTVGVVPGAFRRIALWPGVDVAALPWDRLTAPTAPPLVATGSRISYHVTAPALTVVGPAIRPAPTSLALALRVVRADGSVESVPLGTIPATGIDADQEIAVGCSEGCRISGIGVLGPPGAAGVSGTVAVSELAVDGRPFDLGAGSWHAPAPVDPGGTPSGGATVSGSFAPGSTTLTYDTNGADKAFLAHASRPEVVVALTTPTSTPSASAATFGGSYVDGSSLLLASAGGVAFVPGGPAAASIVNLDNLLAQGWRGRGSATLTAYLDTADPDAVARVTTALQANGIHVVATRHAAAVAAAYGETAAAWSLKLALAVGVLAILVAGVGIVVLASTARRARSRDYAALALVGQRPRSLALLAQLETVPVIVASALIGAAVGWWAAPVAVSMMPRHAVWASVTSESTATPTPWACVRAASIAALASDLAAPRY